MHQLDPTGSHALSFVNLLHCAESDTLTFPSTSRIQEGQAPMACFQPRRTIQFRNYCGWTEKQLTDFREIYVWTMEGYQYLTDFLWIQHFDFPSAISLLSTEHVHHRAQWRELKTLSYLSSSCLRILIWLCIRRRNVKWIVRSAPGLNSYVQAHLSPSPEPRPCVHLWKHCNGANV